MQDSAGQVASSAADAPQLVERIARVTQTLRNSLRELGLDERVHHLAHDVPDTEDHLRYIARLTEQAAAKVLNSAEAAQPLQAEIKAAAISLRADLLKVDATHITPEQYRDLVATTNAVLEQMRLAAQKTHDELLSIIMAQDFQDLTGQLIAKILNVVNSVQNDLLKILADNLPADRKVESSLLNGPQVNPKAPDVMANQDDVDKLLANFGL